MSDTVPITWTIDILLIVTNSATYEFEINDSLIHHGKIFSRCESAAAGAGRQEHDSPQQMSFTEKAWT